MWDLPRPGIEPMFPSLAGRFFFFYHWDPRESLRCLFRGRWMEALIKPRTVHWVNGSWWKKPGKSSFSLHQFKMTHFVALQNYVKPEFGTIFKLNSTIINEKTSSEEIGNFNILICPIVICIVDNSVLLVKVNYMYRYICLFIND